MPSKAKQEEDVARTEDENPARGPHDPHIPVESQQTSTGGGKDRGA